MEIISQSLIKLQKYIEQQNYRGWDPYDALSSPLFKLPFFKSNKPIRFFAQQTGKRFPINLRPLFLVPKGYNPVTLGLCIQGYSYLHKVETDESIKKGLTNKLEFLINELIRLKSKGFSGACWGYDFDWEHRYFKIPAYQPSVVVTGIITNALFQCFKITNNESALNLCKDSTNFIIKDLKRTYSGNSFCFSYSPFDDQMIHNASMKGSRLLSQVYSITKDSRVLELATKSVEFVINHQNSDGSWFYSKKKTGEWVDNYHTGYVLDCLSEYISLTGDKRFTENLNHGIEYYVKNLFENNEVPKFYNNKTYPVDCTAGGQSILTLTRFGYLDLAKNVAEFMLKNMQGKEGFFYFRNYGKIIDKTSFMRWSNAWMFAALGMLLSKMN